MLAWVRAPTRHSELPEPQGGLYPHLYTSLSWSSAMGWARHQQAAQWWCCQCWRVCIELRWGELADVHSNAQGLDPRALGMLRCSQSNRQEPDNSPGSGSGWGSMPQECDLQNKQDNSARVFLDNQFPLYSRLTAWSIATELQLKIYLKWIRCCQLYRDFASNGPNQMPIGLQKELLTHGCNAPSENQSSCTSTQIQDGLYDPKYCKRKDKYWSSLFPLDLFSKPAVYVYSPCLKHRSFLPKMKSRADLLAYKGKGRSSEHNW